MKWHFGTTIVIAMRMDPTSQKRTHNDNVATDIVYAHVKATSEHNSPTKVDPKQIADNKVPNPISQHNTCHHLSTKHTIN